MSYQGRFCMLLALAYLVVTTKSVFPFGCFKPCLQKSKDPNDDLDEIRASRLAFDDDSKEKRLKRFWHWHKKNKTHQSYPSHKTDGSTQPDPVVLVRKEHPMLSTRLIQRLSIGSGATRKITSSKAVHVAPATPTFNTRPLHSPPKTSHELVHGHGLAIPIISPDSLYSAVDLIGASLPNATLLIRLQQLRLLSFKKCGSDCWSLWTTSSTGFPFSREGLEFTSSSDTVTNTNDTRWVSAETYATSKSNEDTPTTRGL